MNKVFTQTLKELTNMVMGDELAEVYVYWWRGNAAGIIKEWFKGDYNEDDIIQAKDSLSLHILGMFYIWVSGRVLRDI